MWSCQKTGFAIHGSEKALKILHLSTYDYDAGASRAAYRLHRSLLESGFSSRMLVYDKFSCDATVIGPENKYERGINLLRPQLDRLPLVLYPQRKGTWSTSLFPNRIEKKVALEDPDLIHLHWVGFGFLPLNALARLRKPILWTMHDMWPFTGGCHYAGDCVHYRDRCGCCPLLGSKFSYDITRIIVQKKISHWRDLKLVAVSPSRWLADLARSSSVLSPYHVEVIPNLLDFDIYKPLERRVARQILNLPDNRKIVLFVAINARHEPRKGYEQLKQGLKILAETTRERNLMLLVVGTGEPEQGGEFPFETRYLGRLHDDYGMALAYSAADVFVAPSAQDNLPNTIMEALACGTPCVAFNVGGIPDMVSHMQNGYLAEDFDPADLAKGIELLVSDDDMNKWFSQEARRSVVDRFAPQSIICQYTNLYEELLAHPDIPR